MDVNVAFSEMNAVSYWEIPDKLKAIQSVISASH
jgi:hypothetical protein